MRRLKADGSTVKAVSVINSATTSSVTTREVTLQGDVGGFGIGSDFSWQVVATYGFDVNCFGTPLHIVIGYRALAVDYSED